MTIQKPTLWQQNSSDYTCPECKRPCGAVLEDDGIGSYEFWGMKAFDSRPYWASSCCYAPLSDLESNLELLPNDGYADD